MTIDRNGRILVAAALLVVAVALTVNYAVLGAEPLSYLLPFALLLLAVFFVVVRGPAPRRASTTAVSAEPAGQPVPVLAAPGAAAGVVTREYLPAAVTAAPSDGTVAPADVTSAPLPGEGQNDLLAIDGIGPKAQAALYAAGINTFEQLSKVSVEHLREIMRDQHVRVVGDSIETWPRQAKFIVDRDYPGLMRYISAYKRRSVE